MTPEKINSTDKKNTKENEKTDPSSILISSLKELQTCNRDITILSSKIPDTIEGHQKRMNLIKTVCERIRDKNLSPEWED
jgi:hypothetical protein